MPEFAALLRARTVKATSGLYAERLRFAKPEEHFVLADIISKEPLGPSVRHGDDQWLDIVRWMHFAMVTAEELGVTSKNVDEMPKSSTNPDIKRLLGTAGNYGESFDRNIGDGSPLKISRGGLNALWTKGGLQYAPPIR